MIIAQISDTHLKEGRRLAYRKVDTASALEAAVRRLNTLDPVPDVVLVSGDLGDLGTAAEYALFKEITKPLRAPIFITPGNHDSRQPMREAFADQPFAKGDFLCLVVDDWPVRIIGLDSTVPGASGGSICEERLRWLSKTLANDTSRPTVVFMHHPPFLAGIGHMDRQCCANAPALGSVLAKHPQVKMMLCGHVHRSIRWQWNGVEVSICPGTSHAVAFDLQDGPPAFTLEPPALQLVVWDESQGFVTHLVFVEAFAGPFPFFDDNGCLID